MQHPLKAASPLMHCVQTSVLQELAAGICGTGKLMMVSMSVEHVQTMTPVPHLWQGAPTLFSESVLMC